MIGKIKIILFAAIVIFGMSGISFAMSCDMDSHKDSGQAYAQDTDAVNVGNKTCPISGEEVDGNTTYEHKGKIYNFCCPMCIDAFKNNPEKYIAKAKEVTSGEHTTHEGHTR
ncbi:MAG: YHS domain-containing protein [Candidatus Omnitrophota bacterium]|nr:YHS domain-containing protein [Candidatus Omnitrophota bacterium]